VEKVVKRRWTSDTKHPTLRLFLVAGRIDKDKNSGFYQASAKIALQTSKNDE